MYKLKISPKAKDDLTEIKCYISQELSNPQAAVNLVSKITKRIRGDVLRIFYSKKPFPYLLRDNGFFVKYMVFVVEIRKSKPLGCSYL